MTNVRELPELPEPDQRKCDGWDGPMLSRRAATICPTPGRWSSREPQRSREATSA